MLSLPPNAIDRQTDRRYAFTVCTTCYAVLHHIALKRPYQKLGRLFAAIQELPSSLDFCFSPRWGVRSGFFQRLLSQSVGNENPRVTYDWTCDVDPIEVKSRDVLPWQRSKVIFFESFIQTHTERHIQQTDCTAKTTKSKFLERFIFDTAVQLCKVMKRYAAGFLGEQDWCYLTNTNSVVQTQGSCCLRRKQQSYLSIPVSDVLRSRSLWLSRVHCWASTRYNLSLHLYFTRLHFFARNAAI